MALRFRSLTGTDEALCLAADAQLKSDGFHFLIDWPSERTWPEYVAYMHRVAAGVDLPPDRVRADFWLVVDESEQVVGRVSIRWELNE